MPKIDVESLKFILQRNEPDIRKIAGIMQEIELELKAEEEEKANRPPPVRKQNVIMISQPDGGFFKKVENNFYQPVEDIVGWIAQIPEDDDLATAPGRVHSAAYEFNTTPKGIRMPVESVGEACEIIPAKFFKEQDIWVKSKTPLLVLRVENKIPTEVKDDGNA